MLKEYFRGGQQMTNCKECGLNVHSEPTCIPGTGNPKADIMIINSYAGDIDEENREATIPPYLLDFVDKLDRDVYYTNAIKCRTPKGTKFKVSEINKCKKHLEQEIATVKPKYILLVGAQALKATVGGTITTLNGVTIEEGGIKYIPTFSPGIVYRDPGKARFVEQALNNFLTLTHGKEIKLPKLNIKILENRRDIDRTFREIREKGYRAFSYDIETTGLSRFDEKITLLGFGNDKVQYIIPLEVPFGPLRGKKLAQKRLVRHTVNELNRTIRTLVAGNGKFDNLFIKHHFGVKPRLDFDVVLGSHILNENTPNGVKENAILECNALDWDINLNLKQGNVRTKQEYKEYLTYLGYDIYYEYKLYRIFKERINQDKSLQRLFYNLYMPVIRAYEDVEEHGVYIYQDQFKEVQEYLEQALQEVIDELSQYKKGVNWSSPQQVADFLYGDLKLPVIETTVTGNPSTSEATLMQLRDKHPAVELILEYRGINIQISHFIDGWIKRMQQGKLHPNFKLLTVTGRTSCTDPNLQQVPRDPRIRSLIGAPPGRTFVEADFSQAELRIAAIMSGDTAMKRIYQTGGDIHTETYELISHEKISSNPIERTEQRKKAKAVNFGFLYGMGWKKFKEYARDNYGLHLSDKEAQESRKKFFQAYNRLPKWHNKQRRIVQSLGQVRNPIGRIRRLPDIYSSDPGKRAEAERQAINSPVQGFGSDLTLLGMAEVMQYSLVYSEEFRLDRTKFDCVGTVHDSVLFEVDNDYLMEFVYNVKHILERPRALEEIFNFVSPVPMVVDVAIGKSWGDEKELDFSGDKWKAQVQEYLDLQE